MIYNELFIYVIEYYYKVLLYSITFFDEKYNIFFIYTYKNIHIV